MNKKKLVYTGCFIFLMLAIPISWYVWQGRVAQKNSKSFRANTEQYLNDLIKREGPKTAWIELKKEFIDTSGNQIEAGNSTDLHLITHLIGAALYRTYGAGGILTCDSSFTYGCYHGFIIEMLSVEGIAALSKVDALCSTSDNKMTCVHGVGQGLFNLNGSDIASALKSCDTFKDDLSYGCEVGVFMQYHIQSMSTATPLPADSWQPCNRVSVSHQAACAESKPDFLDEYYHKNAKYISAFCQKAATKEMENKCMVDLAYTISRHARNDANEITTNCSMVPEKYHDTCLTEAARLTAARKLKGWEESAQSLCKEVSQEGSATCAQMISM